MNKQVPNKQEYVESRSHTALAKKWRMSLTSLDAYAIEQGWDKEHKLYWRDVALEVLKKSTEEQKLGAVKELLKIVGFSRPVGRPTKEEVKRNIAIETRLADEYNQDISRMEQYSLRTMK